MPTCWAMVPKTSPLLRGFPEAPIFSGLVRLSFETARTDPCFPLFAIHIPLLYGWHSHTARTGRQQAERVAELAPAYESAARDRTITRSPSLLMPCYSAAVPYL